MSTVTAVPLQPIKRSYVVYLWIGIVLGAMLAAALAGRYAPVWRLPMRSLIAAIVGGLLLGYGARLAYGCNIGAYFSGILSGSLHGWLWLVVCTDISERRRAAQMLRSVGSVDELTRLLNRSASVELMDRLLAGPGRDRVAVVCGDLDDFRRVNSSLGHERTAISAWVLVRMPSTMACARASVAWSQISAMS